jgi:anti-sigma regulatory factor (Ser/Thr protein kinase)
MTVAQWMGGLGAESLHQGASGSPAGGSLPEPLPEPLRLSFAARAEQVTIARHALAAWGRQAGLGSRAVDDLQTIVNEACMNAASHAYKDGDGRIEVGADATDTGVSVCVRDNGDGIHPRPADPKVSRRLGILLIAALASKMEIRSRRGEGTEIRATLDR